MYSSRIQCSGLGARAEVESPVIPGSYLLSSYPLEFGIEEKPLSYGRARLVSVSGGLTRYSDAVMSHGFDLGLIPNLTLDYFADKDWNITPICDGDFDTKSAKFGAGTPAIMPVAPDRATIQARDAINGRNFIANQTRTFYSDFPIALAAGEGVVLAALGYSAVDGGGTESTELYTMTVTRPAGTPGATDPLLTSVSIEVTDHGGGGDVDYAVAWTPNAYVVDGTHEVYVAVNSYRDDDSLFADGTQTSPDGTRTMALSAPGEGGLPSGYGFRVDITLILTSTGAELDFKSAYDYT